MDEGAFKAQERAFQEHVTGQVHESGDEIQATQECTDEEILNTMAKTVQMRRKMRMKRISLFLTQK